jgi:hypothetical protein
MSSRRESEYEESTQKRMRRCAGCKQALNNHTWDINRKDQWTSESLTCLRICIGHGDLSHANCDKRNQI